jgi:hypothetical protein
VTVRLGTIHVLVTVRLGTILVLVTVRLGTIHVLVTVRLGTILANNQTDHFLMYLFIYLFISLLYMFRATHCSSSEKSVVSIHHLVCITL